MLDLKIVPISRAQYFQLVIVCLQTCEEFRGIDFKAPLFCVLLEEIKKKNKTKNRFWDYSDRVLTGSQLEITNALARIDF